MVGFGFEVNKGMIIIVTVESYTPLKNGVQEITQSYAEYLSGVGHSVKVVTQMVQGASRNEMIN